MCDFRQPKFEDGTTVKHIGNVEDVEMGEAGSYQVGHTGAATLYYDGEKAYSPGEVLPDGMYWKDHSEDFEGFKL